MFTTLRSVYFQWNVYVCVCVSARAICRRGGQATTHCRQHIISINAKRKEFRRQMSFNTFFCAPSVRSAWRLKLDSTGRTLYRSWAGTRNHQHFCVRIFRVVSNRNNSISTTWMRCNLIIFPFNTAAAAVSLFNCLMVSVEENGWETERERESGKPVNYNGDGGQTMSTRPVNV